MGMTTLLLKNLKNSLKIRKGLGIAIRIALLSWLVTMLTLVLFVLMIIPQQKRFFLENLESKANSVAVSLHGVAAGAAVNEDFASVVSASETIVNGDPDLEFLVVMKNDGFSLIIEKNRWRAETEIGDYWLPEKRDTAGEIATVPLLDRRVYHYAQPFDYSGIQWGWIHVGLSLKGYDHSVELLYRNTSFLSLACITFSLILSLVYAERLVRPILDLRQLVQRIAAGNLSVRAKGYGHDELGNLAESVNTMTEALLRRDRILESVRFAAQQFMQTSQWENAITSVLRAVGQAADVSRAYIFENFPDDSGDQCCCLRYEWTAPDISEQIHNPEMQNISYSAAGMERWKNVLGNNEIIAGFVSGMPESERTILDPQNIRALIVIPVFAEGVWWGFLGLDDCVRDRLWSDGEKDSIRAAADMLGATIVRQRTQEALVLAKEEADQASRAKSEFLANMSHELRTPLNHIIGFTDLVLSRNFGGLTDEQDDFLKDVAGSSRHLLSLINDILDLSKVEAGKMELELSNVRIQDLLESSLVMFKERALKNAIRLTLDEEQIPAYARLDERKIKQVVYNLLSNAVKFTPAGGEIRIGAKVRRTSELNNQQLRESSIDEVLVVWVSDTGIGLEQQDLTRIFNPFEQVEGSASRKFSGTGLGLAITRKMIGLHSGEIWAESEGLGKGSTFIFAIPLTNSAAETQNEDTDENRTEFRDRKNENH